MTRERESGPSEIIQVCLMFLCTLYNFDRKEVAMSVSFLAFYCLTPLSLSLSFCPLPLLSFLKFASYSLSFLFITIGILNSLRIIRILR